MPSMAASSWSRCSIDRVELRVQASLGALFDICDEFNDGIEREPSSLTQHDEGESLENVCGVLPTQTVAPHGMDEPTALPQVEGRRG